MTWMTYLVTVKTTGGEFEELELQGRSVAEVKEFCGTVPWIAEVWHVTVTD